MIIEDNDDILIMLKTMLSMKGYSITILSNPSEIESKIADLTPDLIVMDMLLSGADGRIICSQLKTNPSYSQIPVLMISAHPNAREECLLAGANNFLEKPFDMQELFKMIENTLAK